ncbi:MAG: AraC family transcriptional regulator [Pyrinomonadaceae bacterium]
MDGRISHIKKKIAEDLSRPWTIKEMAEEARISEPHFRRVFREETGITPSAYRTDLRLKRASELLTDPDDFRLIKEIAVECGFMNESNFTREFKKRHGMTPTECRHQAWEIHQSNHPDE